MSLPNTRFFLPQAKPFLKWAGGKTQLIEQIVPHLPEELGQGRIRRYAEPFVGGGALFFHIAQSYNIDSFLIADANEELILAYRTIRKDVVRLIDMLKEMQHKYRRLSPSGQKEYFYEVRSELNSKLPEIDYGRFSEAWTARKKTSWKSPASCRGPKFVWEILRNARTSLHMKHLSISTRHTAQ